MLELINIRAGYGRINVLDNISLQVGDGEFVGVLGKNGMGKTTLMRTIVGELPATQGEILWQGQAVQQQAPHQRATQGLGFVPQGRRIFPNLSVYENLLFAASICEPRAAKQLVDEVVVDFPALPRLFDRPGGQLSGGEQQILALARCLCTRPRMILLDEPTEGIQPSIIEEMVFLLRRLRERHGLAMILVEQNLDFLRALSDRMVLLEKGKVVRQAQVSDTAAMDALVEAAEAC